MCIRDSACTDIVTGIFSSYRVQGLAVHIRPFLSHDFSQIINRFSDPVKGSSQKAFGKPDVYKRQITFRSAAPACLKWIVSIEFLNRIEKTDGV